MWIEGWLLDIRFEDDTAVLWIRDPEGDRVKLLDRCAPDFYAEPRGVEAERLRRPLEGHESIFRVTAERRRSSIRGLGETTVLRVRVDRVDNYRRVLSQLEPLPYIGEVYDSDLPHAQRYLCDRGLIPWGRVVAEAGNDGFIRSIAAIEEVEVEPPPLRVLNFRTEQEGDRGTVTTFDDRMGAEYVFSGPVREVFHDFLDYFAEADPDVVVCGDGDLEAVLRFGKLYRLRRFGRICWGRPTLWGGRVHVRPSTFESVGLAGLVELVRCARAPPRMLVGLTGSRAVEHLLQSLILRRSPATRPSERFTAAARRGRGG